MKRSQLVGRDSGLNARLELLSIHYLPLLAEPAFAVERELPGAELAQRVHEHALRPPPQLRSSRLRPRRRLRDDGQVVENEMLGRRKKRHGEDADGVKR